MSAAPGVRDYGLLSATAQMNAQVDSLFTLPPSAFSPPPEVYSTVLRLHFAPRFAELGVDAAGFDSFLKTVLRAEAQDAAEQPARRGIFRRTIASAWPGQHSCTGTRRVLALEPMAEFYDLY